MKSQLRSFIVPSIPTAALLVMSTVAIWFFTFFTDTIGISRTQNYAITEGTRILLLPDGFWSQSLVVLVALVNAYVLAQFNNKFTFIRTRTFIPLFVFMLLMACWTDIHLDLGAHLLLLLLALALYYFFTCYRNGNATEAAFMGSFLLSISAIFLQPILLLIPVCWIGLIMLQSFSGRMWMASIFGIITPWILYIAAKFGLNPDFDVAVWLSENFILKFHLATVPIHTLIYLVLLDILLVICLVGTYSISNSDSIHTRAKLNFLTLILVVIQLICLLFENQLLSLLPLMAFIYAILIAHPLTLISSKFYSILFTIFVSVNFLFILSQYII